MIDNLPFPPGANLVAYLRDSGGAEQEASIELKEQIIREGEFAEDLRIINISPTI